MSKNKVVEKILEEIMTKRKEKEKQQKWIAERNKEYDDFLEKERKRAATDWKSVN